MFYASKIISHNFQHFTRLSTLDQGSEASLALPLVYHWSNDEYATFRKFDYFSSLVYSLMSSFVPDRYSRKPIKVSLKSHALFNGLLCVNCSLSCKNYLIPLSCLRINWYCLAKITQTKHILLNHLINCAINQACLVR